MMKQEKLDLILGGEEQLTPSSGFVASVMERVRAEAAALEPISFPWKRILPAVVLLAGALVWCGVELVRRGLPEMQTEMFAGSQLPAAMVQPVKDAGWVAVALGLSLCSWLLSRRLVGRSGLL
jgi:hypothetical protein